MLVISFFSYKGGSGRSSTLVNTVPFLGTKLEADAEHPIVLIDMDLDSTGLTYLLHQGDKITEDTLTIQGVMVDGVKGGNDFLTKELTNHLFFSSLLKVGEEFGLEGGAVLLLPAEAGVAVGNDGTNRNMSNRESSHIDRIVELCERYDCSAVVFDSSSGDQDTANVSNSKADIIVCCMRPTVQFQEGTLGYFKRMNRIIRNRHVLLLPTAVSQAELVVDGNRYPLTAKNQIVNRFENELSETGNIIHLDALLDSDFGIPLVRRFLWKEIILATLAQEELTDDERSALEMYKKVASLIAQYGNRGDQH